MPKSNTTEHLERFIRSFIVKSRQGRWRHLLLTRPAKAASKLFKIEQDLNPKVCSRVNHAWDAACGYSDDTVGVYFDGLSSPRYKSLQDAIDECTEKVVDAIFSVSPGEIAYVFYHEGWAWICRKPGVKV